MRYSEHSYSRNPQPYWLLRRVRNFMIGIAGFGVAAIVGGGGELTSSMVATAQDCDIKGNISIDSGERIFHAPGQRDYHRTRISPEKGERWFCSEGEALAAGWRKARN